MPSAHDSFSRSLVQAIGSETAAVRTALPEVIIFASAMVRKLSPSGFVDVVTKVFARIVLRNIDEGVSEPNPLDDKQNHQSYIFRKPTHTNIADVSVILGHLETQTRAV